MKLSDAIRVGAKMSKQGFGPDSLGGQERCVLGAAQAAIGESAKTFLDCKLHLRWPELYTMERVRCPEGCRPLGGDWLQSILFHVNDSHRWTREAIADWLDTLDAPKPDSESAEFNKVATEAAETLASVTA